MRKLSVILFACLLAACGTPAENTQEHNCSDCKDKNIVVETIMARRSIRNYEERPVSRETMDIIADCGIHAANAMNAQKWEVRLVDDPEFINGITALYVEQMKNDPRGARMVEDPSFKNMFRNAPTVAFIAMKDENPMTLIDCGLLAGNMITSAKALGIGSVCLGGPVMFMKSPAAKPYLEKLALPEGYQLQLAIGFGYPAENPDAKPRDPEKVKWVE